MSDAYSILGVNHAATPSEIRRAYYRLALLVHPDKLPPSATPAERASAEERFKLIASAYEVLSDADKRAQYDAGGIAAAATWGAAHQRSSRDTFRSFFGSWDDDTDARAGEVGEGFGGGIALEERDAEDAINLPLFEGYLVLDIRKSLYRSADAGSVAGAIPCAAEDLHVMGWDAWFARTAAAHEFSHERLSPVVILGGHVAIARSLASFLTSCAARDASELSTPLRRLSTHCRSIWLIRGGTTAILTCLPCLHASLPQHPTPHVIAPGLLLGSRVVPWHSDHLTSGLGVSHVVVAKQDGSVSLALPGLVRLELDISDDDADEGTDSLFAAWAAAAAFIDGATTAGGRVLVRVHGRSRSASVVLAWMARAHALPVAMAARILRSKCPGIDWNLAFPDKVIEWLSTFEGKTSICA